VGSLSSTGPAALGGTLAITTDPGFSPAAAQSFVVLTSPAITGTFAATTGTAVGDGHTYTVNVSGVNVNLVGNGVGSNGSNAALSLTDAWKQHGTAMLALER